MGRLCNLLQISRSTLLRDAAGCTHRHVLADERNRWRTIGYDVRVEGWPAGVRSAGTAVVLAIDITVSRWRFLSA